MLNQALKKQLNLVYYKHMQTLKLWYWIMEVTTVALTF